MADEITVTQNIRVKNGNLEITKSHAGKKFTQDAIGGPVPGFQKIGTSEETVSTTDIGTLGYCWMKNLDDTNYIEVGFSTGVYGIRLEAGEVALFRLNPSSTIYAKANTAECNAEISIFED